MVKNYIETLRELIEYWRQRDLYELESIKRTLEILKYLKKIKGKVEKELEKDGQEGVDIAKAVKAWAEKIIANYS